MKGFFSEKIELADAGLKGDCRCFCLLKDFHYLSSYGKITVPAGFITDGASIPKVFWGILSPFGAYFPAAIIHDYLYSAVSPNTFTRQEADLIFKEAMYNIGIPWYVREVIFNAVRAFGWTGFKKV